MSRNIQRCMFLYIGPRNNFEWRAVPWVKVPCQRLCLTYHYIISLRFGNTYGFQAIDQ